MESNNEAENPTMFMACKSVDDEKITKSLHYCNLSIIYSVHWMEQKLTNALNAGLWDAISYMQQPGWKAHDNQDCSLNEKLEKLLKKKLSISASSKENVTDPRTKYLTLIHMEYLLEALDTCNSECQPPTWW